MQRDKIRVAIVGVGNCASALVQATRYYAERGAEEQLTGLINEKVGTYDVADIEFVAAFDVNATKVGKDLSEAVFADPNNTLHFADVPRTGVAVSRGPTMDGIGTYLQDIIGLSEDQPVDVAETLRRCGAEVLVNYLPVGAEAATRHYVEQAIAAGCGVVNCIPVFIASDPAWVSRFNEAGLPIIGDDIKSQVGATILHRSLVTLFEERGIKIDRTYQLNFGGNTDFQGMLERERLASKKVSKTRSVTSQLGIQLPPDDVHVGPSDFVPWLKDRKWAQIRIEGRGVGGAPVNLELKLEVWDSPNSAAVVLDAIRCIKLALDRGEAGVIDGASSYFMKSPPVQRNDHAARQAVLDYIGASPRGDDGPI